MLIIKSKWLNCLKQARLDKLQTCLEVQQDPDEIEDIYKWLYDNIDLFGDEEKQESAIPIIKQGLVDLLLVRS